MIHARVSDLIGHTPLVALSSSIPGWQLLLKLEKFNPGQSMKDRMAVAMLDDAVAQGRLPPEGTVIESSSGNTGTALALLCAERGYHFVAVVDRHAAADKIRTMKAYGAEIVFVEGAENEVATLARETRAAALAKTIPRSVFLEQAHNPANSAAYEQTMASEIFRATGAHVDLLVGSVGTGGSLSGCARGLKSRIPNLRVVGVEPAGSIIFGGPPMPYFQSGTGTPGGVEVGRNVDYSVIDDGRTVTDRVAFNTARFLARNHGLLIGGAAGGVVHVALQVMAERKSGGVAVALLADGGEKYLDTVFDDAWMDRNGLLEPAIERKLLEWVRPAHAAR